MPIRSIFFFVSLLAATGIACSSPPAVTDTAPSDATDVVLPDAPLVEVAGRAPRTISGTVGFTCIVRDSHAYCWGANRAHQSAPAGDPSSGPRVPTRVDGVENVVEVAAGDQHACALDATGSVFCWGTNNEMELGSAGNGWTPRPVPGLSGIVQIEAGQFATCARDRYGVLTCWGAFPWSARGTSLTTNIPPTVIEGTGPVVSFSTDGFTLCVVGTEGQVRCAGANDSGQLGDGTRVDRPTFAPVPGVSDVVDLAVRAGHPCVLTRAGQISCWGRDFVSLTGGNHTTPMPVPGSADGIAITVGTSHACVLRASHEVACWGRDAPTLLGSNPEATSPSPLPVATLGNDVDEIGATTNTTCARRHDGSMVCWGSHAEEGLPGYGGATSTPTPVHTLAGIASIAGGRSIRCAVPADGHALCWGSGGFAEFSSDYSVVSLPLPIAGLDPVANIALGGQFACAVMLDGTVRCWGNRSAPLGGTGASPPLTMPMPVAGATDVASMAAGLSFACLRHVDNTVACWGANAHGQLGDATTTDSTMPRTIASLGAVSSLTAGSAHACAVVADGSVKCWGANADEQLGDASTVDRSSPVTVMGVSNAVALSAFQNTTCAALADGRVACWGHGFGARQFIAGTTGAVGVSYGYETGCLWRADGTVACWGRGRSGALGVPGLALSPMAVDVPGLHDVREIVFGMDSACARIADGTVSCWGSDEFFELGNGPLVDPDRTL